MTYCLKIIMEYKSYHYHYYHHYTTSLKIAVGETQIFSMPNISHIEWPYIYIPNIEYIRNLENSFFLDKIHVFCLIGCHLLHFSIIKFKFVIA